MSIGIGLIWKYAFIQYCLRQAAIFDVMEFYPMIFPHPEKARGACIALLGGGGKTAILYRLGQELARHQRVLLTSITRASSSSPYPVHWRDSVLQEGKFHGPPDHNPFYLMGYAARPDKTQGIEASDLPAFLPHFDTTILECDGARNRPLKAHNEQDPKVPDCCTHVIIIIGADAVDTRLENGLVHRPDLFADTWSHAREGKLTSSFIAEVVTTRKGYLAKVPHGLEPLYLVNKVERYPQQARELGVAIAARTGRPAVVASLDEETWEWVK